MNTLRMAWLCVALAASAACVSSGGSVSEPAAGNEAAVANMNLGAGYLRQGNTDLAIERLERALAQDPKLVQAHTTIAVAYNQIGKFDEAEDHFKRAAQLAPQDGAAANAYAAYLCERGNRWAEARPYFRRAADDAAHRDDRAPQRDVALRHGAHQVDDRLPDRRDDAGAGSGERRELPAQRQGAREGQGDVCVKRMNHARPRALMRPRT